MWYFAWILGLPLAAAFAVLNAMWFELMEDEAIRRDRLDPTAASPGAAAATPASAAGAGQPAGSGRAS